MNHNIYLLEFKMRLSPFNMGENKPCPRFEYKQYSGSRTRPKNRATSLLLSGVSSMESAADAVSLGQEPAARVENGQQYISGIRKQHTSGIGQQHMGEVRQVAEGVGTEVQVVGAGM